MTMLVQMKICERNILHRLYPKPGQPCIVRLLQVDTLSHRVRSLIQVEPIDHHFVVTRVEEEITEQKRTNWSRPTDEPRNLKGDRIETLSTPTRNGASSPSVLD